MTRAAEQYREKLLETVPNNQQGQNLRQRGDQQL